MAEPGADDIGLIYEVHEALERLGLTDALALAEAVVLYRNHPLWALWLPVGGRDWTAVRPAGSRPPRPEVPLLWVHAATAVRLVDRIRSADAGLSPPGQGR